MRSCNFSDIVALEKIKRGTIRMLEMDTSSDAVIPESIMLSRLAQAEQLREFFIQMWLQNPDMAERAGSRVQELLAPERRPGGTDFSG